ncbi:class I SAM-dependent RNA methyltransferase [Altererythrobacter xixiisoli]|uniref:Class I SAM-dependent RNA methyltransferase n=1 Tax=Croceibacterium xixiisoli TaxID=1476466 RepID=A0A6I4TVL3_9SPHN|nr:class I SAM-dependent RNA methyltransferase [Croceibacterium xixiisoli]MXO99852.1 class I SAM-dependent RNA methyltransferase [Croceibacterium xixiisoli]
MTEAETILRIASKGDGVTASGRHAALAAPGDLLHGDGRVEPGPHHATPPCRHFLHCGGCELQHCDDPSLIDYITGRAVFVAANNGITADKLAPTHLSPPHSRRRASLRAQNGGGRPVIGFREAGSHRVIDLRECTILAPELFALIEPLRRMLGKRRDRYGFDIVLTLVDQGVDCAIKGLELEGLEQTEALLDFCRDNRLARMALDMGYGAETMWEPEPATITLSGVRVDMPSGAFLQATPDGEAALVAAAREWLADAPRVMDLFSGLGTFAFALADRSQVVAVEAARDAHLACSMAAKRARVPVEASHRDLFRNPVRPEEFKGFDGVVLDPPRAGAREQVLRLAGSDVPRIVYISCNPSSWGRDAKTLVDAGYRLAELRPVGQFRWSTHVELASLFVKDAAQS